jgi:glycine/D-amino acid oxidase-like deaminating enzyme
MAAYVMAKGGLDVILVEADRIATGGTSSGLGAIVPQPDLTFRTTADAIGLRAARTAWKETRLSALDLASTLRKLRIKCDARPAPLLINALSPDDAKELRRDQTARKAAGIAAPWLSAAATDTAIATDTGGSIKLAEGLTLDPVRAALGFVRAAERAGARVFERSEVTRTRFDRAAAVVMLAKGTIHTRGIYVATGGPGALFRSLRRHVREFDACTVVTQPLTAEMRHETGRRENLLVEYADDVHWLRWLPEERAMFSGALGAPIAPRLLEKTLVQRTGQLMYELSLRYPVISGLPARWSWPVRIVTTADGLPWIGAHRNYPFHFFGIAFGWQSEALGWFAARAALRHFKDATRKEDAVFSFTR